MGGTLNIEHRTVNGYKKNLGSWRLERSGREVMSSLRGYSGAPLRERLQVLPQRDIEEWWQLGRVWFNIVFIFLL